MTDIKETISKLETQNGALGVKIAANKARIRALVGKVAGVKAGDVVVLSGQRYKVEAIVSETVPAKGKPVLRGLKIAKNGNVAKRPVEIKGAWAAEGEIAVAPAKKRGRPAKAATEAPAKRRPGRPRKIDVNTEALGTA
jgi:hypothetical protein